MENRKVILLSCLKGANPGSGECLARRRVLLGAVEQWLSQGRDSDVGFHALLFVVSPEFESQSADPVDDNRLRLIYGIFGIDELQAILDPWPRVHVHIRQAPVLYWKYVDELVGTWAYPSRGGANLPDEIGDLMRSAAMRMLNDLRPQLESHPGVLRKARKIANNLHEVYEISLTRELEILYPDFDYEHWQESQDQQLNAVRELAIEWCQARPGEIVSRLNWLENEAVLGGLRWPRLTPVLWDELAIRVSSPTEWVQSILATDGYGEGIHPFLRESCQTNPPDWIALAKQCLLQPKAKFAAVATVLTMQDPPAELLGQVLSDLSGYTVWIEAECMRGEIPERTIGRLLLHHDPDVARAAVEGEWNAPPAGTVRDSLKANWRQAIVKHGADTHWLALFFEGNADLASEWLCARLAEGPRVGYRIESEPVCEVATRALDPAKRQKVLAEVSGRFGEEHLIACLVNGDLDLYRELLGTKRLQRCHMAPLAGIPEGVWIDKAKVALDAGYGLKTSRTPSIGILGFPGWEMSL